MNANSYIVIAILPLLFIVPILLRRRIRKVFSKTWPWVILGIIVTLFLVFVRDIPLARHGMSVVKSPETNFDSHLYWRSIDPNINATWESVYFGKGAIVYDNNFTINDYNAFIKKLDALYTQNGHTLVETDVIKNIVQAGQNEMVTHIVPADLCPFTIHLLAIAMMFPKFRKNFSIPVAMWAILGGVLAISVAPFQKWAMDPPVLEVVLGSFVGTHFLQIMVGVLAMIVAPKISWKDSVKSIFFIFGMGAYIAIIYWMTNITMQTTGVADGDWLAGGEYYIVPSTLKMNGKSIHAIRFVGWMIFIIMQTLLLILAFYCQKLDKKYCDKVQEGPIYKYFESMFVKIQTSFKNGVKDPIVLLTKKSVGKVKQHWKYFWESEDNFND